MIDDSIDQKLFTAGDASRLVGVSAASARRWLAGYTYTYNGEQRSRGAKIGSRAGEVDGVLMMSFLDLVEVRMAMNFRKSKVSWERINRAAAFFRSSWQSEHPFALQRFRSDGKYALAEIAGQLKDRHLLDVSTNQFVFDALLSQSLFDVLDFREDGLPFRMWLQGRESGIVVDPARAFGRPIVDQAGIPVSTLVTAYAANDNDIDRVARWFEIPPATVEAAIRYEANRRLAA